MKLVRYILLTVIVAIYSSRYASNAHAIGEFALGLNAGATYDPNNLEEQISRYNLALQSYELTGNASTSQISVPYSPVFGFNIRYQFNFFFFRIGSHYTTPFQTVKGSITPNAGVKNTIKIETYQMSIPATIGLLVPLSNRTHFFIGAGPTYHHSSVTITQSNPNQVGFLLNDAAVDPYGSLTANKRDRYSAAYVGYHLMVGAEIPVHEKFTLSVEWIHQEGRSHPVENDGVDSADAATVTPRRTLDARGDFLVFGLNYYISF
ncbi:MAG TPA: outer membrane beta-barrel protein [Spirochaetota bacterium]|nr:outer membrane beta-barrel protein [Spirochaetota bacterium]